MRFVCCLWRGSGFWRKVARYDERHVHVLASMLKRHGNHSLTCLQDGNFSVDGIVMPDHVKSLPNYLPKLWVWSPEFHNLIGERFIYIDLDVVIANDLGPLMGNDGFKIWNRARDELYNSSIFSIDPGFGQHVWTRFTPGEIHKARRLARRWTGDQSWIAYVLGPGMPTFGEESGVIQYRPTIHRKFMPQGLLAAFMNGPFEPSSEVEKSPWVKNLWQVTDSD